MSNAYNETSAPTTSSRKLNRSVAKGIMAWLNNVDAEYKVKALVSLKDAQVFLNLAKLILSELSYDHLSDFIENIHDTVNTNTVDEKFDFLHTVFTKVFALNGHILVGLAKNGDEYELAKVNLNIYNLF